MAWQIGPFSIRSGATISVGFFWDEDPGVQVVQAFPVVSDRGGGGLIIPQSGELRLNSMSIEHRTDGGPSSPRAIIYRLSVSHRGATGRLPADPLEFVIRGGEL